MGVRYVSCCRPRAGRAGVERAHPLLVLRGAPRQAFHGGCSQSEVIGLQDELVQPPDVEHSSQKSWSQRYASLAPAHGRAKQPGRRGRASPGHAMTIFGAMRAVLVAAAVLAAAALCAGCPAEGPTARQARAMRPPLPHTLRLRGGVRPPRTTTGAGARGASAQSDFQPSHDNPLATLELSDADDDADLAPEDLELEDKSLIEDEFVQSPQDEVDSDLEPFLDDSDFTTRDGFDLTTARRFRPVSPLMTDADEDEDRAQLVVPDMIASIPAAVRAAELAHRDTQQVPLVFVRSGEYRWREGIVLVEKYELDIPPFCDMQHTIFINNSTEHWKYEAPFPVVNATRKTVRLRLSGDTGSLLWGAWHFAKGSSAELSQVQLRDFFKKSKK